MNENRNAILGAVIGDIAGSRFEFNNYKRKKDYHLLTERCRFTDDTVMTVAIAEALMVSKKDPDTVGAQAIASMQSWGRKYPEAGYGGNFYEWIFDKDPRPYNSWGNGAAMRVSACAQLADSPDEARLLSKAVTEVTHDHPEGIKGAEAITMAVFLAKTGTDREGIRKEIEENYYALDFTLDQIRKKYRFDVSCQGSVPQAIEAFLESTDFEDAIRNAISIGGDSDTIAAMCGSIAAVYYGVPETIKEKTLDYLDEEMIAIINMAGS